MELRQVLKVCPVCDQKGVGFDLPDGRYICPNCTHDAVFRRWQFEWEPIARKLKKEQDAKRRAAEAQARQEAAQEEAKRKAAEIRERRQKEIEAEAIRKAERAKLLPTLSEQFRMVTLREHLQWSTRHRAASGAAISRDAWAGSALGGVLALAGAFDDDPYVFSAGLSISDRSNAESRMRSHELRHHHRGPQRIQNPRLFAWQVAQAKVTELNSQPVGHCRIPGQFVSRVHDIHQVEGSGLEGKICLVRDKTRDKTFDYPVRFDLKSGRWLVTDPP